VNCILGRCHCGSGELPLPVPAGFSGAVLCGPRGPSQFSPVHVGADQRRGKVLRWPSPCPRRALRCHGDQHQSPCQGHVITQWSINSANDPSSTRVVEDDHVTRFPWQPGTWTHVRLCRCPALLRSSQQWTFQEPTADPGSTPRRSCLLRKRSVWPLTPNPSSNPDHNPWT